MFLLMDVTTWKNCSNVAKQSHVQIVYQRLLIAIQILEMLQIRHNKNTHTQKLKVQIVKKSGVQNHFSY